METNSLNTFDGNSLEFGNKEQIEYVKKNQKPSKITIEIPKWLRSRIYDAAKGKQVGAQKMLAELFMKEYGSSNNDPNQTTIG